MYYQNPYQQYQQYQPMIPQQMPQMAQQAQQMQTPQMRTGITGRTVKSVEEIAPSEVPMDGTVAFFPAQDGSKIFAKGWNTDGTISTIEYAPIHPNESANTPTLFDVMNQLSNIQDLLKAANKPARKTTKKGENDDASD